MQLDDPPTYEGGDLEFWAGSVRQAARNRGSVIVFPSYLLHRVTPGDPVSAAMALVEGEGMTRIPVVDGDRLEGMVCFNRSHEAFCIYPS